MDKRYQIEKRQALMTFMDSSFRNSLPSTTDWLSKWIGAYKKQTYLKDDQKKNHPDSKETSTKGTASNNNKPITYLPMMWKILTVQIKAEIYYSQISRGKFSEEQKGYHKGTRRTGDLQYIDQHIHKESKTRRKNLVKRGLTTKRHKIWSHSAG